jgi:hypothetical protein
LRPLRILRDLGDQKLLTAEFAEKLRRVRKVIHFGRNPNLFSLRLRKRFNVDSFGLSIIQ